MKNKKYLIVLGVFVLLIATAAIAYKPLSEKYSPEVQMSVRESETAEESTAPPESETAKETTTVTTAATTKATTEKDDSTPDFTVLDASGNEVKLSDFYGKPIIINFWATWCEPCKSELPAFNNIYNEYGDKVTILMINLTDGSRDTVDGVKKFAEDNGYDFPIYFDTEQSAAQAYGLYSVPVSVYIDGKGELYGINTGSMSEETIKRHLDDMLKDEEE